MITQPPQPIHAFDLHSQWLGGCSEDPGKGQGRVAMLLGGAQEGSAEVQIVPSRI